MIQQGAQLTVKRGNVHTKIIEPCVGRQKILLSEGRLPRGSRDDGLKIEKVVGYAMKSRSRTAWKSVHEDTSKSDSPDVK